MDPDQAFYEMMSLEERLYRSLGSRRANLVLVGASSILALILAFVGIYGVVSFTVGRRTHEIGIRMAIGAKPKSVLWNFLGEALLLSGIGGFIGFSMVVVIFKVAAASPLTKYMGAPEISVPVTFLAVGVLTLVAVTAGYFPARKAASMNPVEALRSTL